MNCKPGDLAVVVRAALTHNIGKLCTILRPGDPDEDGFNWHIRFDRPTDCVDYGTGKRSRATDMEAPDSWLRPIRPGDVTDEEVRDLYAPDRSMKDSPASDTTSPSEKKETV